MAARRVRFACWITKATDTHIEYVTVIAFPLQQWLHERASMLRHSALLVWLFFLSGETEGERKVVPPRTLKAYSRNRGITAHIVKLWDWMVVSGQLKASAA